MKKLSIKQIADIINARISGNADGFATGVCFDSQLVKPGDCFFAINAGHNFVEAAFNSGAVCAVIDQQAPRVIATTDKCILKVPNSVKAMGDLAAAYRKMLDVKIVGITGSAGKTTTRNIIYHILCEKFNCHQSPKNFNNQIGLPFTILTTEEDHNIAIVEMGASSPGEISYLSKIAQPDIVLITNTYPAHLEGFGSIDNIIAEKASIAHGLKPNGKLLVNARMDKLKQYLINKNINFEQFEAVNGRCEGIKSYFRIDDIEIEVPLTGPANLENTAAAWAVCKEFGITADQFAKRIKTVQPGEMRLEIQQIDRFTIINDCYNANPASMENALSVLKNLASDKHGRSVFICGPMMELGQDSEKLHEQLGKAIAKTEIDLLLVVGQFAKSTAKGISDTRNNNITVEIFENTQNLADNVHQFIKSDDIILIKGSRSTQLEQVLEKIKNANI